MPLNSKPKKCNKLVLLRNVIFGLSFIFVASINDNPKKDDTRSPSSVRPSQIHNHSSSHFLKNPLVKHTRKLTVPMMTHIESNKSTFESGDTITLTGHLKVTSDIKNVKINWLLPKDIELINGSLASFLSATEQGQDYNFQITVKSNSSTNQIIHLVAKTEDGSSFYSNSAQFHTVNNKKLREVHSDLQKRAESYMAKQNALIEE